MAEPLTPLGQQIDDAVAINRAATPARATTQRRVPRVSIAELNAMDRDMLHDRLKEAIKNAENRGPVESVLDLLDLPRNTIANIVLPGVAEAKRAEGDKGTFGMGRVHFSDLLEKMGLGPGVVRGVLGFVGDVATDPLTYIGPGAIAKVGSKAGEVGVAASRFGSLDKALTGEVARVAKGGTLDSTTAIGRAVSAAVEGEEGLAKLKATVPATDLQNQIARAAKGKPEGGVVRKGLTRIGLAEPTSTGGILSYLGTDLTTATPAEAAKAQAAKDLYLEFGKGTEPGLAFGKNATSQIAHIPFTNVGIRVPALSASARNAEKILTIAHDTSTGVDALAKVSPHVAQGVAGAKATSQAVDDLNLARDTHLAEAEPLGAEIANLSTELDKLRGENPEALGTRHFVHQAPSTFADIKRAIGAIDPGTVEGEKGAGVYAASIDAKLNEMENGPQRSGRGAFLTDSRAEYLADPENGAKALLARAYRNKRSGDHVIAQHGNVVGLAPERLRAGDTWQLGNDTLTVLEHDPETGISTIKWQPMENKGSVAAGERIVKVGPQVTGADGNKFATMIPANEHSFIGSVPVADAEAVAKRDRLIQATRELHELRAAHIQKINQIMAAAEVGVAQAKAALQMAKPLPTAELSAQELITLGRMSDRAEDQRDLAQAAHEELTAGLGIRKDLVDRWENKGLVGEAADKLNEVQKDLYHRVSADPAHAGRLADLMRKKVDAYQNLSQALNAPIQSFMGGQDKAMAEVARAALGMADDQLGITVFGSMARSANRYLGSDSNTANLFRAIDNQYQRMFGNRSGSLHQNFKEWSAAINNPARAMTPIAATLTKELNGILAAKFGEDAYKHLPEASQLLLAEWYRLQAGGSDAYSLVKWGTKDEPSELLKVMRKAETEGLYAGQDGPAMKASIQAAAKQMADFYGEMGDIEVADRVLGAKKAHSVPNLLTGPGQKELARVNRIRQESATGVPRGTERVRTARR